jgi:type II secretory pathway predicted ATPase ExeA
MNNTKHHLKLIGLKWNPFTQEIPYDGIVIPEAINKYLWKIENLVMEGGFALVYGDPGTGKSILLRTIEEHLKSLREVKVGILSRPQSSLSDFYRELGSIYDIGFNSNNKFSGYRSLREKWHLHIESTLFRPVLIIDEAQEMLDATLSELRLLSSTKLDSQVVLSVILCGDKRLLDKFRSPSLLPLGSRIKIRIQTESLSKTDLTDQLDQVLTKAGNPTLMTKDLKKTLIDHSGGNWRVLTTMAGEILAETIAKEQSQMTEDIFFELYKHTKGKKSDAGKREAAT